MVKRPLFFTISTTLFSVVILAIIFIEPIHIRVKEIYDYLYDSSVALFVGFFFVKGKFIFRVVAKKIIILSVSGLGKRYLIEKVLTYHFKIHFFNHIKRDLIRLYEHILDNFLHYSIGKKIVSFFGMLASLGLVTKFMGKLLALKVLFAKIWSFLLAFVIKMGSSLLYFVTDYLWASWLAPLLDILIFSWILKLLAKMPFLEEAIQKIYDVIKYLVRLVDRVFAFLFQKHIKSILSYFLHKSKRLIYKFIGYKQPSIYKQLQELREFNPSKYQQLKAKRALRKREKKESIYQKLKSKKESRDRS